MRIQPPKQVQLIFHRGAKVHQKQPKDKLIRDDSGLLTWEENDRAVVTFRNLAEIDTRKSTLAGIIQDWIIVTDLKINTAQNK